ncbi:MAG: co-chaperone GroES [Candidatus Moranbacteria bacterium CG_4_9_14_3_um_filter_40_7]|nr:MAG: co-chaperone GroES [Candidatus Moranbacteria bacterium CG23_combo_of_CG06-09_8_20_14_all_40_16]PIU80664.1 MAG: co-chaperone GroES [Candidatus Moranbacteria bacterium CG06_land_8_20_14_3_00_40_12]PJA88221.1 MAG: co-chaperone GroES [Candidatus Moranbacteria bacterium CG_4_9_14_3_um_filter_40_7]
MKKENIYPLRDNVLVKLIKKDAKTKSGIVLPETVSEDKPQEGKIIAVGDSKEIKVKSGQTVIFAKYSGTEIKINAEDYLLIKNEDLLAIVR